MIRAVVTGSVWSTRHVDGLPAGAFLEVMPHGGASPIIAFDVLGTGVGEHVLVAQGSVAAAYFPSPAPPVDALIIGSIDPPGETASAPSQVRKPSRQRQVQ